MPDGDKMDPESTDNISSDTPAPDGSPSRKPSDADKGPGQLGVELSRIKECLRDLATDTITPREERDALREFYIHRRDTLQLRLIVLNQTEKVKAREIALENARKAVLTARSGSSGHPLDSPSQAALLKAESEVIVADASLVQARTDLGTASSIWERSHLDDAKLGKPKSAARRWEISREWEAITPDELKPAISALRHAFEHQACFRPERSTMKLCYAALHPPATPESAQKNIEALSPYKRSLVALLGKEVEPHLLGSNHPAPVIFRSYIDILESALKVVVRGVFHEIFEIADARCDLLHTHPLEWTKRQVEILISGVKSGIRFWIKSVCDSVTTSPNEVNTDSLFWGTWRAPRLIHMQPAGNTRYDEGTAWAREELTRSEEILEGRAERLTEFLRIELDEILRAAHIAYVKQAPSTPRVPPQRDRARRISSDPISPLSEQGQTPDFWRSLHDKFRELSEEELVLAPRNIGDRWLRAYVDYKSDRTTCGHWHLSGGVSETLRERFEVEATRAGIAFGSGSSAEPLLIWLHHAFLDLLEHDSELLFAASKDGGIILRACEASAVYCARLEKQALIDSRNASTSIQETGTAQPGSIREAIIKKVKNPDKYTVLSTLEAAAYFQVKPRTIYRWTVEGNLRNGARRGSITVESVLRLEKKRARKRPTFSE